MPRLSPSAYQGKRCYANTNLHSCALGLGLTRLSLNACVLSRVQWSQFKGYFIFKLEKVMDDFRTSAPEPRGPPNPNVEYIPFEEMKERILKIVTGFNGYVSFVF